MRRLMLISFIVLPLLPFALGVLLQLKSTPAPRNPPNDASTCLTAEGLVSAIELSPCQLFLESSPDALNFYLNTADHPPGADIYLNLHTPAGTLVRTATTNGQTVRLRIPYMRAGLLPYTVRIGSESFSGQLQRHAGAAFTPLVLNIGARMARVTGDHAPALLLHPLDRYNNVSASPVTVTTIAPNQEVWQQTLAVEHLLAWTFLPVPQQTGKLQVIAQAGEARGERGEVDLLAGTLASSRVTMQRDAALASGRDTWALQLQGLNDALNNPIEDGTALHYVGGNAELDFFLTRPSIQAEQHLVLPAYPRAGDYQLGVIAGNYQSESWQLSSQGLDQVTPYRWLSNEVLALGPIMDSNQALMDDGTPVDIQVRNTAGEVMASWQEVLQAGEALVVLPPLGSEAASLHISLLGEERVFDLP